MNLIYQAKVNGRNSCGSYYLRNQNKRIYAFREFGKLVYSGDLINFRKTRREAYLDAGAILPETFPKSKNDI